MQTYLHFIGIDIGKFEVVVASSSDPSISSFPNTPAGFKEFLKDFKPYLKDALVILETTGGYERLFLNGLCNKNIAVHRANTRHVKSFIRSFGIYGKTDAIDAIQLVRYGQERHARLSLYQLDVEAEKLKSLVERRMELISMLVAEKNRLGAPAISPFIAKSCLQMIRLLEAQIASVTEALENAVAANSELTEKKEILKTLPGIGDVLSMLLIVLLPELGKLNRRQIASLGGIAPYPRESGTKCGYRRTFGGRPGVKSLLFLAGMSAARSKSALGERYRKMVNGGKKKMVALVALMRKIIVIANARVKEFLLSKSASVVAVPSCEATA